MLCMGRLGWSKVKDQFGRFSIEDYAYIDCQREARIVAEMHSRGGALRYARGLPFFFQIAEKNTFTIPACIPEQNTFA